MSHRFQLGQKLKCKITGFEGIAVGRLEYINGCTQYGIKQKMVSKEGEPIKYPDNTYIDEEQLEVVDDGVKVNTRPGGAENFAVKSERII